MMIQHTRTKFSKERYAVDSKAGDYGEAVISAFLAKMGRIVLNVSQLTKGPFPDYDVLSIDPMTGTRKTIEVKYDGKHYPNVPIPIFDSSKPASEITLKGWPYSCNSGIYRSKADTFMVYSAYYKRIYSADRRTLINYLDSNPSLAKRERRNKSYGEVSAIALIPRESWGDLGTVWDVSELIPDDDPRFDPMLTLAMTRMYGTLSISRPYRIG